MFLNILIKVMSPIAKFLNVFSWSSHCSLHILLLLLFLVLLSRHLCKPVTAPFASVALAPLTARSGAPRTLASRFLGSYWKDLREKLEAGPAAS